MTEPDPYRISDADRLDAVEALGEHYATGRLDKAEYDQRSDQVLAARTDRDLRPVFADLPLPHGSVSAAVPPPMPAPPPVFASPWRPRRAPSWRLRLAVPLVVLALIVLTGAPWLLLIPLVIFLRSTQIRGRCLAARGRSAYPHRTASSRYWVG